MEINKLLGYVINLASHDLDKMELKKPKKNQRVCQMRFKIWLPWSICLSEIFDGMVGLFFGLNVSQSGEKLLTHKKSAASAILFFTENSLSWTKTNIERRKNIVESKYTLLVIHCILQRPQLRSNHTMIERWNISIRNWGSSWQIQNTSIQFSLKTFKHHLYYKYI